MMPENGSHEFSTGEHDGQAARRELHGSARGKTGEASEAVDEHTQVIPVHITEAPRPQPANNSKWWIATLIHKILPRSERCEEKRPTQAAREAAAIIATPVSDEHRTVIVHRSATFNDLINELQATYIAPIEARFHETHRAAGSWTAALNERGGNGGKTIEITNRAEGTVLQAVQQMSDAIIKLSYSVTPNTQAKPQHLVAEPGAWSQECGSTEGRSDWEPPPIKKRYNRGKGFYPTNRNGLAKYRW